MTLVTPQDQNTLDILLNLINRKSAHIREGKAIDKLYAIYKKELKAMEGQMHSTANGTLMLISAMTDDHLFNTIQLFARKNYGDLSNIPDKFMDEAKKRPGMVERISNIESVIEPEETIEYDIAW